MRTYKTLLATYPLPLFCHYKKHKKESGWFTTAGAHGVAGYQPEKLYTVVKVRLDGGQIVYASACAVLDHWWRCCTSRIFAAPAIITRLHTRGWDDTDNAEIPVFPMNSATKAELDKVFDYTKHPTFQSEHEVMNFMYIALAQAYLDLGITYGASAGSFSKAVWMTYRNATTSGKLVDMAQKLSAMYNEGAPYSPVSTCGPGYGDDGGQTLGELGNLISATYARQGYYIHCNTVDAYGFIKVAILTGGNLPKGHKPRPITPRYLFDHYSKEVTQKQEEEFTAWREKYNLPPYTKDFLKGVKGVSELAPLGAWPHY